jgi:TPR repeat protein
MTRFLKAIGVVAALVLLFIAPAHAQTAATDRYIFEEMLKLAARGDPEAEYHVGMMLNNGIGTAPDRKAAFEWFKKSAEAGDPLGAFKLGCYYAGQFPGVVEVDHELALKYKLVAAEQGYDLAQSDVGKHRYDAKDYPEAIRWWTLAASQGDPGSMYRLSAVYAQGLIAEVDLVASYRYLDALRRQPEFSSDPTITGAFAMLTGMMSTADIAAAQEAAAFTTEPTALTLKARAGISQAEEHLAKNLQ